MEKSDKSKSYLENQRGEDSQFLIHILLYNYIINMPLYRLQIRKEIETKYLLQSLT